MATNFESCLSMLSRIRTSSQNSSIDPEILDASNIVSIVDAQSSQSIAKTVFIYHLIEKSLSRSTENANCRPTKNVMLIDGGNLFNPYDFSRAFLEDQTRLKQLELFRPRNDNDMLIYLHDNLQKQMAINGHLKLIVIVSNPSCLFPDLITKINGLIFSLSISVPIILVADHLNMNLKKFYQAKPGCNILTIKSCDPPADNRMDMIIIKNKSITIQRTIKFIPVQNGD